MEVAGEKKRADTFQTAESLWEFTKPDDWRYYFFTVFKTYSPGDLEISTENIAGTIMKDADKLIPLYKYLKEKLT
jgi:hypothetical protein